MELPSSFEFSNDNINFVSIMLHYQDSYLYPTLNALAKTNYFLVPFLTSSDEEATQRFKDKLYKEIKKSSRAIGF